MSVTAQRTFMNNGGVYAGILQAKYDSGELVPPERYEHQEYPKMIRRKLGKMVVTKTTMRIRGKEELPYEWDEEEEQFEDILVRSEAEEERVINGGKSEAQIEAERQDMIAECKRRGLHVDPSLTYLQLQRQLGTAPSLAEVETLQARVQQLEQEAALRARIAELEAQLRQPGDETETLRAQLRELGIEPDGRWGITRLRQELERATAPENAE